MQGKREVEGKRKSKGLQKCIEEERGRKKNIGNERGHAEREIVSIC